MAFSCLIPLIHSPTTMNSMRGLDLQGDVFSILVHLTLSKKAPTRSPVTNGNSTPNRFFKRLFRPPSPAKCIVARQHVSSVKRNEAAWVWIRDLILQEFKKRSPVNLPTKSWF
ncbi:uncharacterized protein LOC106445135 isoform X2 [Brassica napus]|uniref:uncharacterized protein LOC106445135 isoform X2 n=1 Tax=Brassica napus TaxID=3708 RepID=UPI000BBEBACE|nr:uncharacterized protein LOC106445135 isoform X2 [Brassica napus]